MAGRFTSIVTTLKLDADKRSYSDIYEYCSQCGACIRRCPVRAISPESGKNHVICSAYVDKMEIKYMPRYGCGKCQTGVPCESGIPLKNTI